MRSDVRAGPGGLVGFGENVRAETCMQASWRARAAYGLNCRQKTQLHKWRPGMREVLN